MKGRLTRLGFLGLAVVAVTAVGASPAAAKTKTATFNQCISTFTPIPAFPAAVGASHNVGAVNIPVTVPKNAKGKPQDGRITAFNTAGVRITHPDAGSLQVSLVSPGGRVATLSNERGGTGDGFGTGATSCAGTLANFSDTSVLSIVNPGNTGQNPVVGTFRPEGPLSTFVNGPAKGFWTLIVDDLSAPVVAGSINAVALNFVYQFNAKSKKKK